ncbi:MAG: J domain-containing protein [Halobacteriaceae archaeon]
MVSVPDWLALGLIIAAGFTIVFAALFALGEHLFPGPASSAGAGQDGAWKRRAEIRAYLEDIHEPYKEDVDVHGFRVAFYLPSHDVAITFDGPTYFRLDRTDTRAILVEHEMPGAQLGARLPFDTPAPTRDRGHSTQTAFEVLGVSPDASVDEVTAAYRDRIKEVHPDHGGDEAAFHRVREAYTVARDAVT